MKIKCKNRSKYYGFNTKWKLRWFSYKTAADVASKSSKNTDYIDGDYEK